MYHAFEPVAEDTAPYLIKGFPGCPSCGAGPLRKSTVNSIFWRGDTPLMVRGIPANVCTACGEDFLSDATVIELDRIRGIGFDGSATDCYVKVPVINFGHLAPEDPK
jgi:YgiT-type zinc finger domain-containing protein